MAYPGAALCAPNGPNVDFSSLLPARIVLRNKETKEPLPSILRRVNTSSTDDEPILKALWQLLNYEIVETGDSYPFDTAFTFEEFKNYYASHDLFVLLREEPLKEDNIIKVSSHHRTNDDDPIVYNFGNVVIGSVHIRPNFPARSKIVANGAFLVVPQHRRFGGAQVLGSFFPIFCKMLGYRTTLFNLVYEVNMPSVMLWRKLGYPEVGRVACAGIMSKKRTNAKSEEEESEVVESAAYLFSINLYEEGKVILPKPKDADEKTSSTFALKLDLEDIMKHVPSKVFGKFLCSSSE